MEYNHRSSDEQSVVEVPINDDKIKKWTEMLNSTDKKDVAFVKILAEMEVNVNKTTESIQKSVINALGNKFGILVNQKRVKVYTSNYLNEIKKTLEISLPIDDLEEFEEFDAELEENIEKRDNLRYLFQYLINGNQGLPVDIASLINSVMRPSVLKNYTGFGKLCRGQKKKNFSLTNMYECMQDVLIDKYEQSEENLDLKGRISRHLSKVNKRYNDYMKNK